MTDETRIELVIGMARTLTLTITDANGDPVHINTSDLYFTVKRTTRNADAAAILRKSSADDITIADTGAEDANKGKAQIAIHAADWVGFDPRGQLDFPWDVVEVAGGEPSTVLGTPVGDAPIRLRPAVTVSVP